MAVGVVLLNTTRPTSDRAPSTTRAACIQLMAAMRSRMNEHVSIARVRDVRKQMSAPYVSRPGSRVSLCNVQANESPQHRFEQR